MDNFLSFVIEEWLLFAIAALLLGLITRSFFIAKLTGVATVNPNEAIRVINDEALILDVRLEKEFKQGHIKNSINIPVGALESRIREIDKHKSDPILICCQTSSRSMLAGKTLRKHGFDKISVLSGGLNAWTNANLPTELGNKRDEDKDKGKNKKKSKHKQNKQNKQNTEANTTVPAITSQLENSDTATNDKDTIITRKEKKSAATEKQITTPKDADFDNTPTTDKQ